MELNPLGWEGQHRTKMYVYMNTTRGLPWEAMVELKSVVAILDAVPEKDLIDKHAAVVKKARLTKSSGCLLAALATVKDAAQLRSQVQCELKELRGHIGKDQERRELHGPLWEKVQGVLKVER